MNRTERKIVAFLLALSRLIDRISHFIGSKVSWIVLLAVLVSCANAISRYAFSISSNAWLELQWYLYGAVFMLASAYTLQRNAHVRIDAIAGRWSKRTRDWLDLICHITFLLPFCLLMIWLCWPWFMRSFNSGEYSSSAGGLIIWPAKSLVLAGFILLLAQSISEIIKRYAVIRGLIEDDPSTQSGEPANGSPNG